MLFLLMVSGFFNLGVVASSPLSEGKAWQVSDTTDPITDIRTLSAFKVFTVDSIEIQTKLSCNASSLKTKSAAFEFNFFATDGTAQQVRQTGHMGKGRYRINLTSYARRLGATKGETMGSIIRYSNQVTDNIEKIKINKGEEFIYKFHLASGEPTIRFSSSEEGLNNVLKACGSLSVFVK